MVSGQTILILGLICQEMVYWHSLTFKACTGLPLLNIHVIYEAKHSNLELCIYTQEVVVNDDQSE